MGERLEKGLQGVITSKTVPAAAFTAAWAMLDGNGKIQPPLRRMVRYHHICLGIQIGEFYQFLVSILRRGMGGIWVGGSFCNRYRRLHYPHVALQGREN